MKQIKIIALLVLVVGLNTALTITIATPHDNPQVAPHDIVSDTVSDTVSDAVSVTVTTYNATKQQCDDTPNITSIGAKITKGVRWVAVSQDLLNFNLNYRDSVYLEVSQPPGSTKNNEDYSGWYKVMDRTSSRLKKTVDILITDGRWGGKWEDKITKIK